MKINNVLQVLSIAAVTMAFTLAIMGPNWAGAEGQNPGIKPLIAQPTLTSAGCQFTVSTDKETYAPGDPLVLIVEAKNPNDKPVETTVWASVSIPSPITPELTFSRVAPPPISLELTKQLSQNGNGPVLQTGSRGATALSIPTAVECSVKLAPGESKTIELKTPITVPATQTMTISLTDKQQTIVAANDVVLTPNRQQDLGQQAAPIQE